MAMAGRVRSSLPLVGKLLRSSSDSLSAPRSAVQLSPAFTDSQFLRNYATASPSVEQTVKVPVPLYGVYGNYASALYIAAVKANSLDKIESELYNLIEAAKGSPTFSQFMQDLSVPTDTRVKAINDICEQAKFSELTKNFLVITAGNGRLRNLEKIANNYKKLAMSHRGEIKATVTTVIPLPAKEEKELKETVQDIIGEGKKVTVEQKIDQSILGGIVVEFGDKVFDISIKTRAKQMERFLRDPINFDNL